MLKVAELLKHLSNHAFHMSPVRLTFSNYLQNCHQAEDEISEELIQNFIYECLDYPHWCQQRNQLTQDLKDALSEGLNSCNESLDLSAVKWASDIQLVEIENLNDFAEAVNAYLSFCYKQQEKFRIVFDPIHKKMVALILAPNGDLTVRTFDKKFMIRHGQLEPLRRDLGLAYDANYELTQINQHKLEVAPYVTARFVQVGDELVGNVVRGYIFQKFHELKGPAPIGYPKLFYSIKRLEHLFLKKETNPFYQSLVADLEKQIQMVKLGDLDANISSAETQAKAQNALEYVFIGDKLLGLLLRDLQHTLGSQKCPPTNSKIEFALTN